MQFEMVGMVVMLLVGISIASLIHSKFISEEGGKTLQSIVESAASGEEEYLVFTPEVNMDVCGQVQGELGCYNPVGVEPYCKVSKGTTYQVHAFPTEKGVCLNITEVA